MKKQKKVLMLVENPYPEDARVRREARTLADAGYKVSVIALRYKQQTWIETDEFGVTAYRIPKVSFFSKNNYKDNFLSKIMHKLQSIAGYVFEYLYFSIACFFMSFLVWAREGFDVVHAHNPPDTLFFIGAFYRIFGKKFVFDHHDLSPELYLSRMGQKGGIIYRGLLFVEKLTYMFSNMVIATNASYKEIAMDRGKKRGDQVAIVRNGPDLDRVKLVAPDERLKSMNKTILGYVGAINPQDGLDYLLRSIHHLVYDIGRTDFYCVIIGSGDSRRDLEIMAKDLKIDEHVWFTGFVTDEELIRYLSTADICVDPDPSSPLNDKSTWIKIMEYMALAKPIVTFDLKETRFSAQASAIYAKPNDEAEFAECIVTLMDDPARRERMGRFGYNRVITKLAWEHVSKNLVEAYDRLTGTKRQVTEKSAKVYNLPQAMQKAMPKGRQEKVA